MKSLNRRDRVIFRDGSVGVVSEDTGDIELKVINLKDSYQWMAHAKDIIAADSNIMLTCSSYDDMDQVTNIISNFDGIDSSIRRRFLDIGFRYPYTLSINANNGSITNGTVDVDEIIRIDLTSRGTLDQFKSWVEFNFERRKVKKHGKFHELWRGK